MEIYNAPDPDDIIRYDKKLVKSIFRQKEKFHHAQASLPIEEKIKILIELQKISLTIRPRHGENDRRIVWTGV
jgi:hypothetical protein